MAALDHHIKKGIESMSRVLIILVIVVLSGCNAGNPVKEVAITQPVISGSKPITEAVALHSFGYTFGKGSLSTAKTLKADFTCDGIQDIVVSTANLNHSQGPRFEVMLVTGHSGKSKIASQSIMYKESSPKSPKYKKAYFLGSGSQEVVVSIKNIPKVEFSKISSSEYACNNFVGVATKGSNAYAFVFDVVYDSFLKKSRFGVREGQELKKTSTEIDFYNTHMI